MDYPAFYVLVGDNAFESTPATAGPWSPDTQHGGPPTALLARAFERLQPDPDQRLARLTVEILRPVPVRPVMVTARIVRPGRRVTLLEGSLQVDGADYVLARGWRIGRSLIPTPASVPRTAPPPRAENGSPLAWEGAFLDGYLRAIEVRQTRGVFAGMGPGAAWIRARIPLLDGEEPTPFQRTAIIADSGSGVSQGVDHRVWQAINVDLTLTVHRDALGEWIHLDSNTVISTDGTGRTDTVLGDAHGEFGRAIQTLVVAAVRSFDREGVSPDTPMSSIAERLRSYFDDHGVAYRLIEHEPAGSVAQYHAVLGTRHEQMPKAVFLRYRGGDGKGFAILALQAHKRADLKRVARLLNARDVRLGSRDELRQVTGCDWGELPPVGRLFGLPLLLDQDLHSEDELYFNAGSLEVSMVVSPDTLEALEQPIRY